MKPIIWDITWIKEALQDGQNTEQIGSRLVSEVVHIPMAILRGSKLPDRLKRRLLPSLIGLKRDEVERIVEEHELLGGYL